MACHTDTTLLGARAIGFEDSHKDQEANLVALMLDGSHNVLPTTSLNFMVDRLTIRGRRR